MRLLRCHIENFGVLSGFDCKFEEGLSVICRENGFGKSTLAAFLKAMFYGLPRTGARRASENERKRYEPWQGGRYGGFLEFAYQNTAYRVTRYFGKTAAKDTFAMYDLTNRTNQTPFTEKLGEELFRLDAESFARSVFLPQMPTREMEATSSIRAKLGDLVDDTNDMNNFDTAQAALRAYRSNLKAYRGAGGEIDRLAQEYNDLENQCMLAQAKLPELEKTSAALDMLSEKKAKTGAQIASLREDIRRAAGQNESILLKKQLKELRKQIQLQEETLQTLQTTYPDGIPAAEEIQRQREHLAALHQAEKRLDSLVLSEEDKRTVEEGTRMFQDADAVERDLKALEDGCRALAGLEMTPPPQMAEAEAQRLHRLSGIFQKGIPDRAEIAEKQEDCRRIAELTGRQSMKGRQTENRAPVSGAQILCLAAGMLLIITGIVIITKNLLVLGASVAIAGTLGLLAAFLIHGRSRAKADAAAKEQAAAETAALLRLRQDVTAFLLQFYSEVKQPEAQLVQLALDKEAYLRLKEQARQIRCDQEERTLRAEELTQKNREILSAYGIADGQDALESMQALRGRWDRYRSAHERAERLEYERSEAIFQKKNAEKALQEFLSRCRLSGDTVQALVQKAERDGQAAEAAKHALDAANGTLETFLREHGETLKTEQEDARLDMQALQAEEQRARESLDAVETQIQTLRQTRERLRRETEQIPEWEDKLQALAEERGTLQKNASWPTGRWSC